MVVMAAKGGAGATTVALHTAERIARAESAVGLVDLDMSKGDVAGFLDLPSRDSVNLLLDRLAHLDAALIEGAALPHGEHLRVFTQPYELTDLRHLTADEVRTLLGALRTHLHRVVVEAGSRVDVVTLSAALLADDVVLVVEPEVVALRDAQRVLRLLERLAVPRERIVVVVNRAGDGPLSADVIGEQLVHDTVFSVPCDRSTARRAEAEGVLWGEIAPRSKALRALHTLADHLAHRADGADDAAATSAGGWFWRKA